MSVVDSNGIEYEEFNGLFFHKQTPQEVRDAILRAYIARFRVRVFLGDTTTGECWLEENDVMGYIGRTTGNIKIPILVHNARSMGGTAILDHCIVRLTDTHGLMLYTHPTFHVPNLTVRGNSVLTDKGTYANCDSSDEAHRLVAFLKGERFTK